MYRPPWNPRSSQATLQLRQATLEDVAPWEAISDDASSEGESLELLPEFDDVAPKAVIDDILQQQLVGVDVLDSTVRIGIAHLKATLQRSVETLARDIYAKEAHFLLELIQNADDNQYAEDAIANVRFHVGDRWLLVSNNEEGFREENVRSLCDVAKSTKKDKKKKESGYIGEKGLGFKSVFRYTDEPHVFSRGFSFKFMSPQASHSAGSADTASRSLGFIVPHWVERTNLEQEHSIPQQRSVTEIFLPAKDEAKHSQALDALHQEVQPHILIFLRRLRRLEVVEGNCLRTISRADDGSDLVTIRERMVTTSSSPRDEELASDSAGLFDRAQRTWRFRVCQRKVFVPPERRVEQRAEIENTDILLAFAVDEDGRAVARRECVFAFLPIRPYGLAFLAQADFLLVSSREEISLDSRWNSWLRDELAGTFVEAFQTIFRQSSTPLATDFYTYLLHSETDEDFFKPVISDIYTKLSGLESVLSDSGEWCFPERIVLPLPNCDCRELLDQEQLRSLGLMYVSSSTPVHNYKVLERLGCRYFSLDILLQYLGQTDLDDCEDGNAPHEEWYRRVFAFMASNPIDDMVERIKGIKMFPRMCNSGRRYHLALNTLQRGQKMLLKDEMAPLLVDMGLNVLDLSLAKEDYYTSRMLLDLGILQPDRWQVATECILVQYEDGTYLQLSDKVRRAHLEFLRVTHSEDLVHKELLVELCKEHLVCNTQAFDGVDSRVAKVAECHIWSEELEAIFHERWSQVPSVHVIARQYFEDESTASSWVNFLCACGACQGLRLVDELEDFHHSLKEEQNRCPWNQRKPYRTFPFTTPPQFPKTYDYYTGAWKTFPVDVRLFLQRDLNRETPETTLDARNTLLQLLDRVWEAEYDEKLGIQMTAYFISFKYSVCQHGKAKCRDPACQTVTFVRALDARQFQEVPFVKTLRRMVVQTSQGPMALQETFAQQLENADSLGSSVPMLNVPLRSESLKQVLGIGSEVNCEALLKRLRQQAQTTPPDMGLACKLYHLLLQECKRNKTNMEYLAQVREAFVEQPLIAAMKEPREHIETTLKYLNPLELWKKCLDAGVVPCEGEEVHVAQACSKYPIYGTVTSVAAWGLLDNRRTVPSELWVDCQPPLGATSSTEVSTRRVWAEEIADFPGLRRKLIDKLALKARKWYKLGSVRWKADNKVFQGHLVSLDHMPEYSDLMDFFKEVLQVAETPGPTDYVKALQSYKEWDISFGWLPGAVVAAYQQLDKFFSRCSNNAECLEALEMLMTQSLLLVSSVSRDGQERLCWAHPHGVLLPDKEDWAKLVHEKRAGIMFLKASRKDLHSMQHFCNSLELERLSDVAKPHVLHQGSPTLAHSLTTLFRQVLPVLAQIVQKDSFKEFSAISEARWRTLTQLEVLCDPTLKVGRKVRGFALKTDNSDYWVDNEKLQIVMKVGEAEFKDRSFVDDASKALCLLLLESHNPCVEQNFRSLFGFKANLETARNCLHLDPLPDEVDQALREGLARPAEDASDCVGETNEEAHNEQDEGSSHTGDPQLSQEGDADTVPQELGHEGEETKVSAVTSDSGEPAAHPSTSCSEPLQEMQQALSTAAKEPSVQGSGPQDESSDPWEDPEADPWQCNGLQVNTADSTVPTSHTPPLAAHSGQQEKQQEEELQEQPQEPHKDEVLEARGDPASSSMYIHAGLAQDLSARDPWEDSDPWRSAVQQEQSASDSTLTRVDAPATDASAHDEDHHVWVDADTTYAPSPDHRDQEQASWWQQSEEPPWEEDTAWEDHGYSSREAPWATNSGSRDHNNAARDIGHCWDDHSTQYAHSRWEPYLDNSMYQAEQQAAEWHPYPNWLEAQQSMENAWAGHASDSWEAIQNYWGETWGHDQQDRDTRTQQEEMVWDWGEWRASSAEAGPTWQGHNWCTSQEQDTQHEWQQEELDWWSKAHSTPSNPGWQQEELDWWSKARSAQSPQSWAAAETSSQDRTQQPENVEISWDQASQSEKDMWWQRQREDYGHQHQQASELAEPYLCERRKRWAQQKEDVQIASHLWQGQWWEQDADLQHPEHAARQQDERQPWWQEEEWEKWPQEKWQEPSVKTDPWQEPSVKTDPWQEPPDQTDVWHEPTSSARAKETSANAPRNLNAASSSFHEHATSAVTASAAHGHSPERVEDSRAEAVWRSADSRDQPEYTPEEQDVANEEVVEPVPHLEPAQLEGRATSSMHSPPHQMLAESSFADRSTSGPDSQQQRPAQQHTETKQASPSAGRQQQQQQQQQQQYHRPSTASASSRPSPLQDPQDAQAERQEPLQPSPSQLEGEAQQQREQFDPSRGGHHVIGRDSPRTPSFRVYERHRQGQRQQHQPPPYAQQNNPAKHVDDKVLANELLNPLESGTVVEGFWLGAWYPATVHAWMSADESYQVYWIGENLQSLLRADHVRVSIAAISPGAASNANNCSPTDAAAAGTFSDAMDAEERVSLLQRWAFSSAERAAQKPLSSGGIVTSHVADMVGSEVLRAHGEERMAEILYQIYHENDGPFYMRTLAPRELEEKTRWLSVEEIKYAHNKISPEFGGGSHAGQPLKTLVDAFKAGTAKVEDFTLAVVLYEGRLHSLNNRRLYCLKKYAEDTGQVVKVKVKFYPLDPVTAKFLMSYSTSNGGESVGIWPSRLGNVKE